MDAVVTRAAKALARMREKKPLVLCLTNTVVTNWTANCLLALGATPAMMEEPGEADELAAKAGAVLINLGTVTARQFEAMTAAARAASTARIPWVLDPVAVDKLSFRRTLVNHLIRLKPTIIRGNHSEIDFILGTVPHSAQGTVPNSAQGTVPNSEFILGTVPHSVLLSTGPIDEIRGTVPSISAGTVPNVAGTVPEVETGTVPGVAAGTVPRIRVGNGVAMLTRVTGTGCAQGALAAAFCAVEPDPVVAALAASLAMGLAGELAFERARRPGSFQIALLDALDELTPEMLIERSRIHD